MGRKNKHYKKNFYNQAYDKLFGMLAIGESKLEAIENGTDKDKIFSYNTYLTYWKHTKYFVNYMKEFHPDVKTFKKARQYVYEWLQFRTDQVDENGEHLSAWTIQTEAKALSKLYGIRPTDADYFTPPKRKRTNIKRSRVSVERDKHFSITNNDELIKFCKGTGLRRSELKKLRGGDLYTKNEIENRLKNYKRKERQGILTEEEKIFMEILTDCQYFDTNYFLLVKGKGGRKRFAPIVGKNKEQIVERIKNTPKNKRVWEYVNTNADIHGYRSDYATYIYKKYARDIKDIPKDATNKGTGKKYQSDVYICRGDEKGKKLDRRAMLICSKALGHNRVSVVAENYLRGL